MDNSSYVNEYKGIPLEYIDRNYRIKQMIKVLKKYKADLMLLQEVDIDIRKILVNEFPTYKVCPLVLYMPSSKKKAGEVIIIKKKLAINIKHTQQIFKSTKVGYSIVTCKLPATTTNDKSKLLIINLHLNSNKLHTYRLRETAEIVKFIQSRPVDEKIIMGGDFNTDFEEIHKSYLDLGLVSTVKNKDSASTYLCEKVMLDYIYVRGFKVKSGKIDQTNDTKTCRIKIFKNYGSDHNPVITKVSI
jgi:endonuclease/exonuclease/phosphatase family metal-dependent hydrolase